VDRDVALHHAVPIRRTMIARLGALSEDGVGALVDLIERPGRSSSWMTTGVASFAGWCVVPRGSPGEGDEPASSHLHLFLLTIVTLNSVSASPAAK